MRRLAYLVALAALLWPVATRTAVAQIPDEVSRVSIFYYPWYGTTASDGRDAHWAQHDHRPPDDIAAAFYPARGPYSSSDTRVLEAQMAEIAAAGVAEIVVSWWGRGSPEDARLGLVLTAAGRHGLTVAI